MNMIKVVFFDLGQTLVQLSSLSVCMENALTKHLPQLATMNITNIVRNWGFGTHKLFLELREKDFLTMKEIHMLCLKQLLENENISLANGQGSQIVTDVWQMFGKTNTLYPDVISTLTQLKQSNHKLGIITDSDTDIVNSIVEKHHLTTFFDTNVISSEVKAYKPNPLLFEEGMKLVKCNAGEAIYVGDSEIDIKGANDVGLITIIVKRNELHDRIIDSEPDFRIKNLSELPQLIERINK